MKQLQTTYTTQELMHLFKHGQTSITRRAVREGWKCKTRQERGGGKLWLFTSMPASTQEQIREASIASLLDECTQEGHARKQVEVIAKQAGLKQLAKLQPKARSRAEARAAIVAIFKQWSMLRGVSTTEARAMFSIKYKLNEIDVEPWIREVLPSFHFDSLARWEKLLETKGIAALGGSAGGNIKHRIDRNPALREAVIAEIVTFYKISCVEILEGLEAKFAPEEVPSLRDLQRWVKQYKRDNEKALLKNQNPDAYKNINMPAFGSYSAGIARINQLWQLDSSPTDILLDDGKRYTIIACLDVATRRVMLHLAKTSNSAGVCAVLRRALLAWGVPYTIKTDNGADYVSYQVTTAVRALGITQEFCTPFSPEQKPHVERVFRTLQHGHITRLAGFIGHNVADRKAIEGRKSFAQRISRKKGEKPAMELRYSPDAFQEILNTWATAIYGERKHSQLKTSPNEAAARAGNTIISITDERALDILLMPVAGNKGLRTVRKDGVHVENGKYIASELGSRVGDQVQVYFDDADAGYIYVYSLNGDFICKACDPELTGVSRREIALGAKENARAMERAFTKEFRKAVNATKPQETAALIRERKQQQADEAAASRPAPKTTPYTTPALEEAALAASYGTMPQEKPLTPAQQALLDRVTAAELSEFLARNVYRTCVGEYSSRVYIVSYTIALAPLRKTRPFTVYD